MVVVTGLLLLEMPFHQIFPFKIKLYFNENNKKKMIKNKSSILVSMTEDLNFWSVISKMQTESMCWVMVY